MKTGPTRRPTGKVARLPMDVRTVVNQSQRNGLSYSGIAAQLRTNRFNLRPAPRPT